MAKWTKGMNVFVRDITGNPRTDRKYRVRSIGDKQAVLDRVDYLREGYKSRGSTFYKNTQEEVDRYMASHTQESYPTWMHTSWSEYFVACGDDNWDAEENYSIEERKSNG